MSVNGLFDQRQPALLALADGSVFPGVSIGATGKTVGEVVFNTAMMGYQEILTDPSYADQIITLTYPHIGNVGINRDDHESRKIWAAGLIIRDLSPIVSNWRGQRTLSESLRRHNIVAIGEVDTRRLTRHLRDHGAQSGCIITHSTDPREVVVAAQQYPGLEGLDLAKVVSTDEQYSWDKGLHALDQIGKPSAISHHVVVYDFGVKQQILRLLVNAGCRLTVVPAQTPVEAVLALKPDGVFLSNGPGDPAACDYAIANINALLAKEIPIFGICLGCQLLALACGGKTKKMKFGHHGANHPVKDLKTERVMITSQNHGFSVDADSLPADLSLTHVSLFDGSVQGIAHNSKPAFAFQGHPEASPGPHDCRGLFSRFSQLMTEPTCLNVQT